MEKPDRLHIVNEADGSSVPFLRGILTRSLQKAGLSFEEAYHVSSEIRKDLAPDTGLTSPQLRIEVGRYLQVNGFDEVLDSYLKHVVEQPLIRVITKDESGSPFSKGQLADSLEVCALPQGMAYDVVQTIEADLLASDQTEVSSADLTEMVLERLEEAAGSETAGVYKRWVEFSDRGRPMIILIGGTTGSGKSTISSELAHRLDIVRTQSTDMLREVMRLLIPERLIPTLHGSSFEAYASLPTTGLERSGEEMIAGYLTQSSQVAVGIEGVLNRAANEKVSLIIEGVHMHPSLMDQIAKETDALVVPVILAVLKSKRLKKRLVGRGQTITSRRSERYIESFKKIWELQSFLLSEADQYNIPIIPNEDEDSTLRLIMQTVSAYLKESESE